MILRVGGRHLAALGIALAGLLLPAAATAAPTVSANQPAALTATSMAVTVFQYHGIQTVTTAAGPVQVMEFGMATASLLGFSMLTPCEIRAGIGNVRYHMAAATGTATSGVTTIQVTSLAATLSDPSPFGLLPVSVSWTVAAPPALGGILVGDTGTLSGVSATLVNAGSAAIKFSGLKQQAFFC